MQKPSDRSATTGDRAWALIAQADEAIGRGGRGRDVTNVPADELSARYRRMSQEAGRTTPLYDSRCLTTAEWQKNPCLPGWEWLSKLAEGRVYLRRHIAGPVNTESKGWKDA